MTLTDYIEHCQELLEKHGNISNFYTSSDPEGNSYYSSGYLPEIRYLQKNELEYRVDSLIDSPDDYDKIEDWAYENDLDLEDDGTFDFSTLEKVILL